MSAASQIQCRDVSVVFDDAVTAVRDVTFTAAAGEIVSLIGPSGCGKTTLLRTMAGLQSATAGTVTLEPAAIARRGEIAFVFQQPALLPWRTSLQNASLPLQLTSSRTDDPTAALDALRAVRLDDAVDRFPHQLSGGMQMRVSIARALVTRPRVLLLDEPFAALDEMLRNELGQLLLDLWQQYGFTAVMVTHNIAESILLSHRIVVMGNGVVSEIIDNPMPYPRNVDLLRTPQFADFYGHVSDAMRRAAECETNLNTLTKPSNDQRVTSEETFR
ncbi:ABC transporter ATP-binding protein [Stieleria varia]|uniref:Bicarbonate transport ATP-binding protein CmpD n=1 Tax=Stieleria varia TaxID=2528005 RepID=A0A5C6B705_9BACT|nr:ABC transporter ATP-binding protein [Stieleria varia]TWU07690.1 Bicarbonate transport ATP-binding protein CmpD [Stieleria varia]